MDFTRENARRRRYFCEFETPESGFTSENARRRRKFCEFETPGSGFTRENTSGCQQIMLVYKHDCQQELYGNCMSKTGFSFSVQHDCQQEHYER